MRYSGCPSCSGKAPWTYDRFIQKSKEIRGNSYSYDKVLPEHVIDGASHVPLVCNTCQHEWWQTVTNHAASHHGCPACGGKIKITFDIFLKRAEQGHGNRYDYSLINSAKFNEENFTYTDIQIRCRTCSNVWQTSAECHIRQKSKCPKCQCSKGELNCIDYLENNNIAYVREFRLSQEDRRRYDFMFQHNGYSYLVEFDGRQHFKYEPFFHRTESAFDECFLIDVQNTKTAIEKGYNVIRIDYSEIDNVDFHLEVALGNASKLYVSENELYQPLLSKL